MDSSAPAARARRHNKSTVRKRLISRVCGCDESEFVLQVVQPSLVGMIDGTVSTLAPIFAPLSRAAAEPHCSSDSRPRSAPGLAWASPSTVRHTVAYRLRKVFSKLGIISRNQLERALSDSPSARQLA
jgi:hypothetical protein